MAAKRVYSDEDRANALAALAANGGNIEQTARQLGLPRKTVSNWASGNRHPEAAHLGRRKKKDLADALEAVAWKIAGALARKINAASLSSAAIALGICIEKMRLLREQATAALDVTSGGHALDHDSLTAADVAAAGALVAEAGFDLPGDGGEEHLDSAPPGPPAQDAPPAA
jgi:transposase-like protein